MTGQSHEETPSYQVGKAELLSGYDTKAVEYGEDSGHLSKREEMVNPMRRGELQRHRNMMAYIIAGTLGPAMSTPTSIAKNLSVLQEIYAEDYSERYNVDISDNDAQVWGKKCAAEDKLGIENSLAALKLGSLNVEVSFDCNPKWGDDSQGKRGR